MEDIKKAIDSNEISLTYSEASQLEVGETYPLYGYISKILDENLSGGKVQVELNNSIELTLVLDDSSKLELIKERAFEPGIFVTKIVEKLNEDGVTSTRYNEETGESEVVEATEDLSVVGTCSTVIYGKKQHSGMM